MALLFAHDLRANTSHLLERKPARTLRQRFALYLWLRHCANASKRNSEAFAIESEPRRSFDEGEIAMRLKFAVSVVSAAVMFSTVGVFAQAADTIALKSGETAELGNVFFVVNCRSLLKGPMTVEVLDGPPEVTASIREQQIIPHAQNCAKPVSGGVLLLTAPKEVKERTQAKVTLRIRYPTPDGERQKARNLDLTLLP